MRSIAIAMLAASLRDDEKVSFLTLNEKRAAVGYAPLEDPPPSATDVERSSVGRKYRSDQARAPAGTSDGGQWVDEGGGGSGSSNGDGTRLAQAPTRPPTTRPRRGENWTATPAQETQLAITGAAARRATEQVRRLDPNWRPTPSLTSTAEGAIRRAEAELAEAQARWKEVTRGAVPETNPLWGTTRLRTELRDRGYEFKKPTKSPGLFFENPATGAQVRIMERPRKEFRTDPSVKQNFDHYYRYRKNIHDPWGPPVPIPNGYD